MLNNNTNSQNINVFPKKDASPEELIEFHTENFKRQFGITLKEGLRNSVNETFYCISEQYRLRVNRSFNR